MLLVLLDRLGLLVMPEKSAPLDLPDLLVQQDQPGQMEKLLI